MINSDRPFPGRCNANDRNDFHIPPKYSTHNCMELYKSTDRRQLVFFRIIIPDDPRGNFEDQLQWFVGMIDGMVL